MISRVIGSPVAWIRESLGAAGWDCLEARGLVLARTFLMISWKTFPHYLRLRDPQARACFSKKQENGWNSQLIEAYGLFD